MPTTRTASPSAGASLAGHRPRRAHRIIASGLALGALAACALPAAAEAKTYRATVTDPAGDAPAPGRDILEVKMRYSTKGNILFVITTAGPIDAAGANAGVGVSVGSTCKKISLIGAGVFSEPDPVVFFKAKGEKKLGKGIEGDGEITANVYTLKAKHSSLKNLKPGCFAVALVDPAAPETEVPTPFDQTGEIKVEK